MAASSHVNRVVCLLAVMWGNHDTVWSLHPWGGGRYPPLRNSCLYSPLRIYMGVGQNVWSLPGRLPPHSSPGQARLFGAVPARSPSLLEGHESPLPCVGFRAASVAFIYLFPLSISLSLPLEHVGVGGWLGGRPRASQWGRRDTFSGAGEEAAGPARMSPAV